MDYHSWAFLCVRNVILRRLLAQVSVGALTFWWYLYIFLIFGSTSTQQYLPSTPRHSSPHIHTTSA
jgi:hypothetical protein